MSEHTGACYEGKARKYAEDVDARPWNAHYERPAMLSLLPALAGARVLDAGCGSGWYAEYLVDQEAEVTAVDFNEEFVALTRARVAGRAEVLRADVSRPLAFAADAVFDLVISPLVLHYLRDWEPTLREFHRVLKPGGVLVFSTHHPFSDWKLFDREDYFAVDLLEDDWEHIGRMTFYRRPLTAMSGDLAAAGFVIERILEPRPNEDFRRVNPEGHARLSRNPGFLVIRAMKRSGDAP